MSGSEISLIPKEFDILYFLAQNQGKVFTKEQIYRAVWADDYLWDDSNIMAFIRKFRKKIEPDPDAPKYVLTIWGIGYIFNDQLLHRRTDTTFGLSPTKFLQNRKEIARFSPWESSCACCIIKVVPVVRYCPAAHLKHV